MSFLLSYQPLLDIFLLNLGLAYSQQIVMRGRAFFQSQLRGSRRWALTPAPFLPSRMAFPPSQRWCWPPWHRRVVWLAGVDTASPGFRGGIYQAIATLAFVQIVLSVALAAESVTGGGFGINEIPKSIGTWHLVVITAVLAWFHVHNPEMGCWASVPRCFASG